MKFYLFLSVSLLISGVLKSQTHHYRNALGKIITTKGDTLDGLISFNVAGMRRVKYRTIFEKKKIKISHSEIKSIKMGYTTYRVFRYRTSSGAFFEGETNTTLLMKEVTLGKLSLFIYYTSRPTGQNGGTIYVENYYLKRESDITPSPIIHYNFKTEMSEFIIDCPELKANVLDKTYRFKDIKSIVNEYNDCK